MRYVTPGVCTPSMFLAWRILASSMALWNSFSRMFLGGRTVRYSATWITRVRVRKSAAAWGSLYSETGAKLARVAYSEIRGRLRRLIGITAAMNTVPIERPAYLGKAAVSGWRAREIRDRSRCRLAGRLGRDCSASAVGSSRSPRKRTRSPSNGQRIRENLGSPVGDQGESLIGAAADSRGGLAEVTRLPPLGHRDHRGKNTVLIEQAAYSGRAVLSSRRAREIRIRSRCRLAGRQS